MQSQAGQGGEAIIGIDLGGSSVRVGIVTRHGVVNVTWQPLPEDRSPENIADFIVELVGHLAASLVLRTPPICAVAVAIPGPMDRDSGYSVVSPNLGWRDVPFGRLLRERISLDVPMFFDHDVRAAAHGERRWGVARDTPNMVYIQVGTGLGAAIVVNNLILEGETGYAAEVGHLQYVRNGHDCGCGRTGCLEQYASARAVERAAPYSKDAADGDAPSTAEDIAVAAGRGDMSAVGAIEAAAVSLAWGIVTSATLLDISTFVLGGGLASSGPVYWNVLHAAVQAGAPSFTGRQLKVMHGGLGDGAGVAGVALVAAAQLGLDWK